MHYHMSVARCFGVGTAARSDRISWNAPGDQVQGCVAARYPWSSSLEWWLRYALRVRSAAVASARRPRNSELASALGWASAKVEIRHRPKVDYTQFRLIFPAHTLLRHRFAFRPPPLSDTARTSLPGAYGSNFSSPPLLQILFSDDV